MCIFCERAKASLDDPLAGFGLDASGSFRYDDNTHSVATVKAKSTGGAAWAATLRQKREAERCEELRRRARLPVTVITGFLGAGKTTFVNHVLSARHGRRLAVIENEFGDVAVDDELLDGGVERGDDSQQVILMPNGCMCCRVRGDLVASLKRLIVKAAGATTSSEQNNSPAKSVVPKQEDMSNAKKEKQSSGIGQGDSGGTIPAGDGSQGTVKLDGVIIECSGLDELAPILQTFFADPFVQEHVRLDAVVCLCDSPRLLRTLVSQPESAGRDATEVDDEGAATNIGDEKEGTRVASNGYHAETVDATASLVASQLALSDRVLLNKSDLITSDEGDSLEAAVKKLFPGASVTRCVRGEVDIDLVLGVEGFSLEKALEMDEHFAEMLSDSYGRDTPSRHHHHHDNNGGEHVKNGDYSDSSLHAGRKAQTVGSPNGRRHGHDRLGARSVGMELTDGPIDWAKFKAWLKAFLEKEGERIWRLKGVLWTSVPDRGSGNGRTTTWGWEAGRRTVLQGLYGHFESDVGEWPSGSTRRSRLVFIGDLPPTVQDTLTAGVRSCIAQPRIRPPPPPSRQLAKTSPSRGASGTGFANRFGSVKFGGRDDHLLL